MRKIVLFILLLCSTCINADNTQVINIDAGQLRLSLWKAADGRLYQLAFGDNKEQVSVPEKTPAKETEWYPCYGNGYIAEPSLQVTHADGNTSTDLQYKNHETVLRKEGVKETIIHLKDNNYPFYVDIHLLCYAAYNMMEMWTEIRHDEQGDIVLYKYASASPC